MLTLKVQTDRDGTTETWQASRDPETGDWYVRKDPEIQWRDEPFASADAGRKDVAQLLRKEHDVRY